MVDQLATVANIVTRQCSTGEAQDMAGALVRMHQDVAVTDSLTIAREFGRSHKHVLRTLDSLIADGTIDQPNFGPISYTDEMNRQQRMIELSEHGALIAMPFVGGRRSRDGQKRLVDAFMTMRSELEQARRIQQSPHIDLGDPAILQRLLIAHTGKAIELEAKVGTLSQAVEAQAPAVREHARVMHASGSQCIADAAKTLGVMQTKLFRWLHENGWIFKRPPGSEWLAHADKLKRGLMTHKITLVRLPDGGEKTRTQARVTPKGLLKLASLVPRATTPCTAGAADA